MWPLLTGWMSMNANASASSKQIDTSAAPWIRSQKVQFGCLAWVSIPASNALRVPFRRLANRLQRFATPAETEGDELLALANPARPPRLDPAGPRGVRTAGAAWRARPAFA